MQPELVFGNNASSAVFSPCRRYRYELWRRWGPSDSFALFIGLNPSTADETNDDPTIRRCIDFARQWRFSGLCMANIFAWRDTDPRGMMAAPDPVGPENDSTLRRLASDAGIVIAAWGRHGKHLSRGNTVRSLIPVLHCLRLNADNSPAHPLYLPKSLTPVLMA